MKFCRWNILIYYVSCASDYKIFWSGMLALRSLTYISPNINEQHFRLRHFTLKLLIDSIEYDMSLWDAWFVIIKLSMSYHHKTCWELQDGDLMVLDPSMKEEAAAEGFVTVVLNAHNEICLLSKSGGLGLSISQVLCLTFPSRPLYPDHHIVWKPAGSYSHVSLCCIYMK